NVVVIDTVRSAYPALQENSAEEWAKVNKLAVKLRNAGLAVILIHHSNKPSDTGSGREAGSTNQLTVLETQIRVAQVFKEKETARQNAALYDGDYDNPVWPLLQAKLPPHHTIYMVTEIRYGKVREWTDLHDRVQWIGYAINTHTDEKMIVSSRSTKQRAKDLALDGEEASVIADRLGRPESMIRDWLELPKR
ncbi:MAG: AAA family ATPase, partial [Pirellulales bacterium]